MSSLPGADTQAEAFRSAAIAAAQEKKWDVAIENYRDALMLEPNDPDTHYNVALTLKYKGAARQAIEEFQTCGSSKLSQPKMFSYKQQRHPR